MNVRVILVNWTLNLFVLADYCLELSSNSISFTIFRMVTRCLLATVLLLARVIALREQKFATEPQDQTAVVGNRATLPCRVINKSGLLQWTKDGFGLGNLSGFTRYSIVGNVDEGQLNLLLFTALRTLRFCTFLSTTSFGLS